MAFGKRSAGDLPPGRLAGLDADTDTLVSAAGVGTVRTRVTNPGQVDRNFIFLAAGVVVVSAAAAVALPSLFSVFTGGVRPISEVIAGLDRPAVRNALAQEAFPDADGRAFMTSLAANFPADHGRLLDTLADSAMAGGDRDDLYAAMNAWGMDFAPGQLKALGRTGAEGFDQFVSILGDALKVIEAEAGGCSARAIETHFRNPNAFADIATYGGRAYQLGMRASRSLIDLSARGRTIPAMDYTLTANDMSALRSTFFSMMGDPQVISLIQAATMPNAQDLQAGLADKVNICQLGRTVLIKLGNLPSGTKAHLWGTAMSGDPTTLMRNGGLSLPFGAAPGSGGPGALFDFRP